MVIIMATTMLHWMDLIWPWVKYSQEFFTGLKTLELNNTSLIVGADNNLKAIMNLIVVLIRKLPFWKFKGEIKYIFLEGRIKLN